MPFEVKNLSYSYNKTDSVLKNISFEVPDGSFTSIIGKTGSGKTTLAKLLCSLLKIQDGSITPKPEIGKTTMVFQYPETQLFEESVLKDVMFGPLNMGLSRKDAENIAKEYLLKTGIEEELFDKAPFELSDGQKRRVALAGILAMESKVLILDEPGAGLDPLSRENILDMIKTAATEKKTTVFMITHNMDEVVKYSDYVIELKNGLPANFGTVREVMEKSDNVPEITKIVRQLYPGTTVLSLEEAISLIKKQEL